MRLKHPKQGYQRLTKAKARLVGHLIGDGALYKTGHDYVLKYEVKDEESLSQFRDDIIQTYGLVPSRELNTSGKTGKLIPFIRLRSKLAYEDLLRYAEYDSYGWHIHSLVMDASLGIKREFLKALFDDEASIKKDRKVYLYSVNLNGLHQIQIILLEFNISSIVYSGFGAKRNVYAVVIKNVNEFRRAIGFHLIRKSQKLKEIVIASNLRRKTSL